MSGICALVLAGMVAVDVTTGQVNLLTIGLAYVSGMNLALHLLKKELQA